MTRLADKVDDLPVIFPSLGVSYFESHDLGSAQTAT
jgi:hypothetical protein